MKNTLEGIITRINVAEEQINGLEDSMVETNDAEQNKEKRMKRNMGNLREFWDKVKCTNIHIIGENHRRRRLREKA